MLFACYAHLELQDSGDAPATHAGAGLLPSVFGGAEVLTSSIKVLGGFPTSELPGNQDVDVGVGSSTYLLALFPGQIKPVKSILRKAIYSGLTFSPTLG